MAPRLPAFALLAGLLLLAPCSASPLDQSVQQPNVPLDWNHNLGPLADAAEDYIQDFDLDDPSGQLNRTVRFLQSLVLFGYACIVSFTEGLPSPFSVPDSVVDARVSSIFDAYVKFLGVGPSSPANLPTVGVWKVSNNPFGGGSCTSIATLPEKVIRWVLV